MRHIALLATLLCTAFSATAQIYQWKDQNGKTVISDKPPVGAVRMQKQTETGGAAVVPQKQPSLADRDMDFRKRQKEGQEKAEKSRAEETQATERNENCLAARRQLEALESGERVSTRNEQGERAYIDDAQREQEISKARRFIEAQCK